MTLVLFKSKIRKRLKFSLRHDKFRGNKVGEKKSPTGSKIFEIKDLVSIIGIKDK
jgi:hypothetical protein